MTLQANLSHSVQEYTVSEISTKIKNLVESECGYVRIKGEISGLKVASSGHGYMNLKDNSSVLAAICWRGTLSRLEFALEEGMEVVASGKITTYAGQSKYQLSVERIEPSGTGALMKMLIQRKDKLEKEGLFDKDRKKKLPFFPSRIGIVTSPTGSVIRDMLHRIEDRCPSHVLLWPSLVQGEGAAASIARGIQGLNNLEPSTRPDVIIVARGGGSIEDLWCFNEEVVVRAIAESSIAVISAIGHETDFTLTDFVSDVRAPTPTAAAEFACPVIEDVRYTVRQNFMRIRDNLWQIVSNKKKILEICNNSLSNPKKIVRNKEQSLDYIMFRLQDMLPNLISKKTILLSNIASRLESPKNIVDMRRLVLSHTSSALSQNTIRLLDRKSLEFSTQSKLLDSVNYTNILNRGFALIKREGKVITGVKGLKPESEVTVTMRDGDITATIKE